MQFSVRVRLCPSVWSFQISSYPLPPDSLGQNRYFRFSPFVSVKSVSVVF